MVKQKSRRALGRGLAHLIPAAPQEGSDDTRDITHVDISALRPNPFQPRHTFVQEEIDGLADSIREQGLLQPILVRRKADWYEIISGERRFRALKKLGNSSAPCIVREMVSDREMLEMSLVENIQREQLNEVEKARAYQRLLTECNLSHEDLSHRVGKSRSSITNTLRLLKLPAEVLELLGNATISAGHARAILALDDPERQRGLAARIAEQGLSVRQTEALAAVKTGGTRVQRKPRKAPPPADPDLQRCIERLQHALGTRVMILQSAGGKGKIEISFFGTDDLNRVLDLLHPA